MDFYWFDGLFFCMCEFVFFVGFCDKGSAFGKSGNSRGGSLMNSTFASSYELLLSAISELELQKDSFVLRPGVDFSRKRKISFRDMILSLTMQGGSLLLHPMTFSSTGFLLISLLFPLSINRGQSFFQMLCVTCFIILHNDFLPCKPMMDFSFWPVTDPT